MRPVITARIARRICELVEYRSQSEVHITNEAIARRVVGATERMVKQVIQDHPELPRQSGGRV